MLTAEVELVLGALDGLVFEENVVFLDGATQMEDGRAAQFEALDLASGRSRRRSNGQASQRWHRFVSKRKRRPASRISVGRWRTGAPPCSSTAERRQIAAPSCRSCCPKWQRRNGGRTLSFRWEATGCQPECLTFRPLIGRGRVAARPK